MNLARRAQEQDYMKNMEAFLRMALKAQNQCRMTLETLAKIKNPPVVFARQANINNGGQQQVNNGAAAGDSVRSTHDVQSIAPAPAANHSAVKSKLLEASHGQRLDTGAQGAAGSTDPQLEAVGAVHGATHR